MCLTPYYFAIYDDGNDYQIGDMVLFSGSSNPNKINEIISVENLQIEQVEILQQRLLEK